MSQIACDAVGCALVERASAAQRLLPFDGSQTRVWRFQCEPAECVPSPLGAFGEG